VSYTSGDFTTGIPSPKDVDREAQANYLNDIAPAIKAFMSRSGSSITTQAKLTYIKCNAIGPDGLYKFKDTTSALYFPAIPGGVIATADYKPFQVSRVVTLRTKAERGLTSRGRIYLPTPSGSVTADGYSSVSGGLVGDSVKVLLDSMAIQDVQNTFRVCVVSAGSAKFNLPGKASVVRRVEVGNVLDTQRRRRESLPEVKISKDINFGIPGATDPD
jgi:hypothetical protein